ncbi:MAG: hypothetical protein IJM50_00460 [Lachnospiraceae bacterium]|nr:hypothetical protein [Lachnospiraceae bacterium]
MNRTAKVLLIALSAILITGGIVMGLWKWLRNRQIMDGPGMINEDKFDFSKTYLTRVSYYRGGGSLGDSHSLDLTFGPDKDGRPEAVVEYSDQPTHDSKEKHKTVRMGSPVVNGVQEIMDRYRMTEWKDLEKTDLFALDAPSMSFIYEFSDGSRYRLGSDLELPEGAYDAIREIRTYIMRYAGIREE